MAPVFDSAELEDGLVCVRYLTPGGGRGRFKVSPEVFRLKETKRGFDLEVMEMSWNRRNQTHRPTKVRTVLLAMKRPEAEALASLGVSIERKREKPGPSGWKKGSVRIIDPEDRRRRHDVLADIYQDYAVTRDDFDVVRVYHVPTGEGVAAKNGNGDPRPWYSVAEARRAILSHYETDHAQAA